MTRTLLTLHRWRALGALVLTAIIATLAHREALAQTWSAVGPPSPRNGLSAIYDPVRDRMVVVGGDPYGSENTGETWGLTFAGAPHWSELAPGGNGADQSAIYDPVRDRMVVFGGQVDFVRTNGTMALAFATGVWSTIGTVGGAPSPRSLAPAVYDPLRDRMLVLGGDTNMPPDSTVYQLPLSGSPQWSAMPTFGAGPGTSTVRSMIYDSYADRLIVLGVDATSVWALSLADPPGWSRLTPGPAPGAGPVVYDPVRNRLLLARAGTAEIWALSLTAEPAWYLIPTSGGPPAVSARALIYDSLRDRLVLFGGALNDTWALTLSGSPQWSPLEVGGPPLAARQNLSTIYAPTLDAMLVFGGQSPASAQLGDLWQFALDGSDAWTPVAASGAAPARTRHAATYDPVHQRMVVIGGLDATLGLTNELSLLSLSGPPAWTHPSVAGTPPAPRQYACATYDSGRDRVILYGGLGASGALRDVWTLAVPDSIPGTAVWSPLATAGAPPTGDPGRAFYQASHDRMVVIEGNAGGTNSETRVWVLSFGSPTPTWAELEGGTLGRSLTAFGADYDPVAERVLLFGGVQGGFSGNPVSSLLALSVSGAIVPPPLDSIPPTIIVSLSPNSLWPANRKMVDIAATVTVSDNADPNPACRLMSIVSNEPDSTSAKGDLANDIQGADFTTRDTVFQVRAERLDGGTGRIYTVTYIATDVSGNSATASATVVVTLKRNAARMALMADGGSGGAMPEAVAATTAWSTIAAGGIGPYPRISHTFVRDPVRGRFVAFGGTHYPNSSQPFFAQMTNSSLFLLGTGAGPAAAAWSGTGAAAAGTRVVAPAASVEAARGAVLRLAAEADGTAGGFALAVSGLRMVSSRTLAFTATLSSQVPATIEVFDVSGRRLEEATLATGRTGPQAASLALRSGLAPGLYLVRLSQAGAVARGRFIVMR